MLLVIRCETKVMGSSRSSLLLQTFFRVLCVIVYGVCKFWPQAYQVLSLEICKARHNRLNRLTIITFRRCFFSFFLAFFISTFKSCWHASKSMLLYYYNCFFFWSCSKGEHFCLTGIFYFALRKKPWFAWWCAERAKQRMLTTKMGVPS